MLEYSRNPVNKVPVGNATVHVFNIGDDNIDSKTVHSFGEEWGKFSSFSDEEIKTAGDQYFDIVKEEYYKGKYVMDMGCGSGRWTKYIIDKAGFVEAVDPSEAIFTASQMLGSYSNIRFNRAAVSSLPFSDNSFDFVFSLGVLHHIPDTRSAMESCVKKVKPGGYFLVYLYYSLDNRGFLFKTAFRLSNLLRKMVSSMPGKLKRFVCDVLAVVLYMPFVLLCRLLIALGLRKAARKIPLYYYSDKSFNIIRNDSLDRFGTPLEQRFSREEIRKMMESCGLEDITFSENEPYWHAIGKKK